MKQIAATLLCAMLALASLPLFTLAANDPGHDSLYVEEQGNSQLNGSLNIISNLSVLGKTDAGALTLYGDGTTPGSGTFIAASSGGTDWLYINTPGNLLLKNLGGGQVKIGSSTATDLNVTGAIYAGGHTLVCLSNGTNCLSGNNTGNISVISAGNGITVTNPYGPTVTIASNATTCLASEYSYWSGSAWLCRADANGGASSGGGWTNTSLTTTTALNVNVTNGNFTVVNGNVGIGTSTPVAQLHVKANGTNVGLIVRGSDGITNLIQWYGASGTLKGAIRDNGDVAVADGSKIFLDGTDNVTYISESSGMNFVAGISRNIYMSAGTFPNVLTVNQNGNVGIGTTAPTQKLDVNGSANFSGTSAQVWVNGSLVCTAANGLCTAGGASSAGGWTNTTLTTTTALNVNVTNGNLTVLNGNVGIGTTTPVTKLDFGAGASTIGQVVNLYTVGNARTGLGLDTGSTAGLRIYAPRVANNYIAFGGITYDAGQAWNEYMRVDSVTGNVGIGTTAPSEKLSVVGNASIGSNLVVNGGKQVDNSGNITVSVGMDGTKKAGIYVADNFAVSSGTPGAFISSAVYNTASYPGYNAFSGFINNAGTPFSVSTALPSGWVYSSYVQVYSGSASSGNYRAQTNTVYSANTGASMGYDAFNYLQVANLSTYIGYLSDGQFAVAPNNLTNLYDFRAAPYATNGYGVIQNRYGLYLEFDNTDTTNAYGIYQLSANVKNYFNGYVGLNTTSPTQLLDVKGSANFSGVNAQVWINGSLVCTAANGLCSGSGTSSAGGWTNTTLTTTTALNVNVTNGNLTVLNGNVGIGTANPTYKLHLPDAGNTANQAYIAGTIFGSDGNGPTLTMGGSPTIFGGGSSSLYMSGSGRVSIGTFPVTTPGSKLSVVGNLAVGSTYAAIAAPTNGAIIEGNVGIGTTTPAGKFDVNGSMRSMSADTAFTTGKGTEIGYYSVGDYGFIQSYDRDASAYKLLSIDGLNITMNTHSGGNVGIGTTLPNTKLDVNGTVRMTSSTSPQLQINYNDSLTSDISVDANGVMTIKGKYLTLYSDASKGVYIGPSATSISIDSFGRSTFTAISAGYTPVIVQANAGQSANLQEWQNGSGTPLAYVNPSGAIFESSGRVCTASNGLCTGSGASSAGGWTNTSTTTSTALDVNVDSGTFFINSTSNNVGIGTTTPNMRLSVKSSGTSTSVFDVLKSDTANPIVHIAESPSGYGQIATWDNVGNIVNLIQGNGASYFNGGNVGIGTTTPTQLLDVNGSGNFSGTNAQVWINGSLVCTASNGLCGSGTTPYQSNAGGWTNTSITTSTALNVNVTNGNFTVVNGNVGIGTNSLVRKLQVESSSLNGIEAAIEIKNTNTNLGAGGSYNLGVYNMMAGNGSVIGQFGANYGTSSGPIWDGGSGVYFTTRTNHPMKFYTNDSYAMVIDTSQRIGIGTTAPGQTLDVRGTALINSSASAGSFQVVNGTGSTQIFVNGNTGKVGVGMNNPTAALTIQATGAGTNAFQVRSENGNAGFLIKSTYDDVHSLEWYGSGLTAVGAIDDLSGTGIGLTGKWMLREGNGNSFTFFGTDSALGAVVRISQPSSGYQNQLLHVTDHNTPLTYFQVGRDSVTGAGIVGIGMNDTNGMALSVNGSANFSGVDAQAWVNGSLVCTAANGLCGSGTTPYQSSAGGWTNTSITTSTALNVNLTTGNLTIANGNAQLGMASPGIYRINVNGTGYFTTGLIIAPGYSLGTTNGGISDTAAMYIRSGGTGFTINMNDNNNGHILLANGGGNVGIGTATPSEKLSVVGNVSISSNLVVNGGRQFDNDGNITLSIGMTSGKKAGLYVADNPTLASGNPGAYISSAIYSTQAFPGYNALSAYIANGNGAYSVLDYNSPGWATVSIVTNAPYNNNSGSVYAQTQTIGITNTGTSHGYNSMNYIQSGNLGSYVGYESFGTFPVGPVNLTNQYDFYAKQIYGSTNGWIQNRYGLYIDFDSSNITNAYGIYQTAANVKNYFNGSVGIGTTNPAAKLHVNNTVSSQPALVVSGAAGQSTALQEWRNATGWPYAAITGVDGNAAHLQLNGPAGQGNGASVDFTSSNTAYNGLVGLDGGGNFILRQGTAGSMFFDYYNNVFFRQGGATYFMTLTGAGKLGIGLQNPTQLLDVNGSANFSGVNAQVWINGSLVCTAANGLCGSGTTPYQSSAGGWTNTTTTTSTALNVNITNGNLTVLTGSVGIGTASPSQKLVVNTGASDGIRIVGTLNPQLQISDGTNEFRMYVASDDSLRFLHQSAPMTEAMMMSGSGNVGIGTSNPAAKLHVQNPSGAGLYVNASTNAADFDFGVGSGSGTTLRFLYGGTVIGYVGAAGVFASGMTGSDLGLRSENNFTITAGGTSSPALFIQKTTGNLGIGTTTPTTKLEVNGSINVTNGNITVQQTNSVCFNANCTARMYYNGTALIIEGQ